MPLGKIGRCWVPLDDPGVARFFARSLFVPHGVSERLAWTAAGWFGSASSRLSRSASLTAILHPATEPGEGPTTQIGGGSAPQVHRLEAAASLLHALFDDLREALPTPQGKPPSWLLIEDYGRGQRLVCMLFAGGDEPAAVLKIRPVADPAPLARERQSLERLQRSLPSHLVGTIPAPLAFAERQQFEALLLAGLAGRVAYAETQASWRPLRHAAAHCAAAAEWLAGFQQATAAAAAAPVETVAALRRRVAAALAGVDGAWLERLGQLEDVAPPPSAAVHGDFWARNLLLPERPGLAGVVDWEAAAPVGPCTQDLFHFAVTYALSFPWTRSRPLPPRLALRNGFLEDNALARALAGYFADYCHRTGLDRRRLADWFAIFLLERAARSAATAVTDPGALEPWVGFLKEIRWADRSVFSG